MVCQGPHKDGSTNVCALMKGFPEATKTRCVKESSDLHFWWKHITHTHTCSGSCYTDKVHRLKLEYRCLTGFPGFDCELVKTWTFPAFPSFISFLLLLSEWQHEHRVVIFVFFANKMSEKVVFFFLPWLNGLFGGCLRNPVSASSHHQHPFLFSFQVDK